MYAVESQGLTKSYFTTQKQPGFGGAVKALLKPDKKEVQAVKGIDLKIEPGEVIGFLGPNGAGKTTTLKMLSGILHPTGGWCKVLGYTPTERKPELLRQLSLVMGNKQQLWWDLPAWDSFVVFRELYEVPEAEFKKRVEYLIEALDLKDKVHTQVRRLSLGERMKCELVAALLYRPQIVFLDEPTLGLDVISQQRIREFLREAHAQDNCTILLTSHYMQDVQELCKRTIVIDKGTVVYDGTLEALSRKFSDSRTIVLTFSREVERADAEGFGEIEAFEGTSVRIQVEKDRTPQVMAGLLQKLPVHDVSVEEVSVEEVIRRLFAENAK